MPIINLEESSDMAGRAANLALALANVEPGGLVLDGYGWNARHEGRVRPCTGFLVVLDDLADRLHVADLLVDTGYGRRVDDYLHLVPKACVLLIGPRYALLRPEFSATERTIREQVQRLFVCFGLSDIGSIAARAVAAVLPRCEDALIDVAIASDATSLPDLLRAANRNARLRLHVDAKDVSRLMSDADAAVGAGGSTTWERCSLGLPTIAVIVAENQRGVIQALARDGVILAVDGSDPSLDQALVEAFRRLGDQDLRRRLAEASRAVCDGQGARRVAEAIIQTRSRVSASGR